MGESMYYSVYIVNNIQYLNITMGTKYSHIGPSSAKLSNAHAPVVPSVAHT
jgi:hypothetical protein